MARLIPKMNINDIRLKPERDVAGILVEQLPPDNLVYHSYPWLREERHSKDRKGTFIEGEADFVILDPKLGFLVLEVKGGTIFYDSRTHLWFRSLPNGNQKEIKNPFEQAAKNMHALKKKIIKTSFQRQKALPCGFGYAVVFPDCEYDGPLPPGSEKSIVLTAKDLPHFHKRIPDALRRWCRATRPRPLSETDLDGIIKGLSPVFKLFPVMHRQIEEQEEILVRLTDDQMRILDFISEHKRVAIKGVAGSGKTMIARVQAQKFADQGLDTLFVCFNKRLAKWIGENLSDSYKNAIQVSNYHQLCLSVCRGANPDFCVPQQDLNQFWGQEAPDHFLEAVDSCERKYDAIIVDEAQDFLPNWWVPLEMMNKDPDGPFYVFYDPAQSLFTGQALALPELGIPMNLPTNCRNTRKIATACGKIAGVDIALKNEAPEGQDAIIQVAPSKDDQVKAVTQILKDWVGQGGLSPSQIAILCHYRRTKSSLADIDNLKKIPIVEDITAWRNNKGVLFNTIRGFKGLEADAVIVMDIYDIDGKRNFSQAELYVACSRAKHLLAMLPYSENFMGNMQ